MASIDYSSPQTKSPGVGRSAGTWAKLLAVWAVGLVVWVIYLVAIGFLLIAILNWTGVSR